jgi:hypothetical protein
MNVFRFEVLPQRAVTNGDSQLDAALFPESIVHFYAYTRFLLLYGETHSPECP